jgi:hypothetical protein
LSKEGQKPICRSIHLSPTTWIVPLTKGYTHVVARYGVISGSAVVGRAERGAADLEKLTQDLAAFVDAMKAATR